MNDIKPKKTIEKKKKPTNIDPTKEELLLAVKNKNKEETEKNKKKEESHPEKKPSDSQEFRVAFQALKTICGSDTKLMHVAITKVFEDNKKFIESSLGFNSKRSPDSYTKTPDGMMAMMEMAYSKSMNVKTQNKNE